MTVIVGNGQPSYRETLNITDPSGSGNFKDPFVGAAGARWDNPTVAFTLKKDDDEIEFQVNTNDCLTCGVVVASIRVMV